MFWVVPRIPTYSVVNASLKHFEDHVVFFWRLSLFRWHSFIFGRLNCIQRNSGSVSTWVVRFMLSLLMKKPRNLPPHRKLTWNLKTMVSNSNLLFQRFIFKFHVSFPGCSRCKGKQRSCPSPEQWFTNPGWLGYIGDEILPRYTGDYFINHDIKIPFN